MGLQLHRFNRIRKSKRRTQFNYARLQYQTQYQYTWRTRFNSETQDLELALQEKGLVFYKNDLFRAVFRYCKFSNQLKYIKI